jgi:hypothetical protein
VKKSRKQSRFRFEKQLADSFTKPLPNPRFFLIYVKQLMLWRFLLSFFVFKVSLVFNIVMFEEDCRKYSMISSLDH